MIVVSNRPPTSVKLPRLLLGLLLLASGSAVAAQSAEPAITLEHRIRVLTPNGHIRVVSIYTDAAKSPTPAEADSTKNPAPTGDGNKEKH
jgi:hypothetical protein